MIIFYKDKKFSQEEPYDISITFHSGYGQVNAFHAPPFRITPVKEGDFVGSTKLGGPVNFMNFQCNPHGNGTHTECVGHISKEDYFVNELISEFHYIVEIITVHPTLLENGDKIIDKAHLEAMLDEDLEYEGLVIRTLPNDDSKKERQYSGSNPTYLTEEAMKYINSKGVRHLLVDFPSVDREEDEGKLICHKTFWGYPDNIQSDKTITELIYVDNEVEDGSYLCQNIISNIRMDAVPSRPILYKYLEE